MSCVIYPQQFNKNYTLFNERVDNTVVNNSNFIGIKYSTPIVSFNNISIMMSLKDTIVDHYFNKFKCEYNNNKYNSIQIQMFHNIEKEILAKYSSYTNALPSYKIDKFIDNSTRIKVNNINNKTIKYGEKNDEIKLVLKISGLWETATEYGIIYKFSVY